MPSILTAFCCAAALVSGAGAQAPGRPSGHESVTRVLDDYIGLYRKDTLEQWRTLFVPGFVATFTADDGSVVTRNLAEFYERQQKYFATGHAIREELSNVMIERTGRLASVRADFTLFDDDVRRPGKLMLLLIEDKGILKISALIFTYHL